MTSTISPDDTGTHNLSHYLRADRCRRPDSTGEMPVYEPKTIGIVPGAAGLADVDTKILLRGSEELARLQLGETLILPVDAEPAPPRHAAPTVYLPGSAVSLAEVLPQPEKRPPDYRGRYRKAPWPRWARDAVVFGSGWAGCAVTILTGVFVLAAVR